MTSLLIFVMLCFVALAAVAQPAHALDKRLKLLFKTSGYGAAAGAVLGAGSMALGGGARNILIGASCGLYAGILLAGYVMVSPNEDDDQGPRDQFSPRKPIGSDEWEKDDNSEEYLKKHHLKKMKDDSTQNLMPLNPELEPMAGGLGTPSQLAIWAPLLSLSF